MNCYWLLSTPLFPAPCWRLHGFPKAEKEIRILPVTPARLSCIEKNLMVLMSVVWCVVLIMVLWLLTVPHC